MSINDSTNSAEVAIENDDSTSKPVWLLKSASAPKLGKNTEGRISYQIVTDGDRLEPQFRIVGNDGGGYYSKEMVPFDKVEACFNAHPDGDPFPSKLLQAAYVGRSSNNAGFLAAILRAEGLLALAPETEGRHVIVGDWAKWKSAVLAESGELIESGPAPAAGDDTQTSPNATAKGGEAPRRKKR